MVAVFALLAGACGGEAELGDADALTRPAIGPNGAVYLTIDGGPSDTALSARSAASEIAASVELHQTVIRDDGTMAMTRVNQRDIPPSPRS